LECPGYGLKLKWIEGVASRGNLRGRMIPSANAPHAASQPSPHWPQLCTNTNDLNTQHFSIANQYASSHPGPPPPPHFPTSPLAELYLAQSRPLHVSRLVSWFNERVAPRLAWVPHQNAWRHMILPMAESSETVLSSILAIAAHDLASEYHPNDVGSQTYHQMSRTYQNKSLALLAQELKSLCAPSSFGSDVSASSAFTLASVIILCNNEFMQPQGAGWRVHLAAAREIIMASKNRSHPQKTLANIEEFLMIEFYEASVWANLTTFDDSNEDVKPFPHSNENAVFTDFVRVIDQITQMERLRFRSQSPSLPHHSGPTPAIIMQIDSARDSMIHLAETINFNVEEDRITFQLVVMMYYHATLIYSCQALGEPPTQDFNAHGSRNEILKYLDSLSGMRIDLFAQDLVWPLFMAGTELRGNPEAHNLIRDGFHSVMQFSRTLDRARVLSFLESWWQSPGTYVSWIDMARTQYRSSHCDFLVV
jgi:hypothetical protein